MYSGITQGLFPVTRVEKQLGQIHYSVLLNDELLTALKIGASISIDGVCQSVTQISGVEVSFTAIAETLKLTTLSGLSVGHRVSVERSLRYGDEIGGHEVAGHVIGTATIKNIIHDQRNLTLELACQPTWMKYIFTKGFIAVDGSSLTIGEVDRPSATFLLHLIPATLQVTNFANKKIGDLVNIELDYKTRTIVDTVENVVNAMSLEKV